MERQSWMIEEEEQMVGAVVKEDKCWGGEEGREITMC